MKYLAKEKRDDMIDAFISTSRYLDDSPNISNIHFNEQMVNRMHPAVLQLNKANVSDTEAAFLDLNLSFNNDTVFTKLYMINRMILILILLISLSPMVIDVPRRPSYGVYTVYTVSQFIRFISASSNVSDFCSRNKFLIAKLLR